MCKVFPTLAPRPRAPCAPRRSVSALWLLGWAACLTVTLLPAWLLELRCGGGAAGRHTRAGAAAVPCRHAASPWGSSTCAMPTRSLVNLHPASRYWVSFRWPTPFSSAMPLSWLAPAPRRYFTPGFFLAALRLPPPSTRACVALLASYAAVNAATGYLFLHRPFAYADGSVGRFMW
jgi:hypothetical protein